MSPLVSCIVPVHDGERYLAEAIDSILAQTHRPLEVIVVDDGSTDGSAAVAAGYGDRVTLVRQPQGGDSAARLAGLKVARGDYVAYLDADDLWLPEKLARQLARFRERPELDVCLTRFQNFWVPELAGEAERYRGHPLSEPSSAYQAGTALFRRECFGTFGAFDPAVRRGGTTIWFLSAADRGAVIETLPEVLMRRRFHTRNITRTQNREFLGAFPRILKAWLDSKRRGSGVPPR